MANPLLALAVEPLNLAPGFNALTAGLQQRWKNQADARQENILSQIVQQQIAGNPEAAQQMAIAANKPDLALKLNEMNLEQKRAFAETVGKYAVLADTPQKWDALRSKLTELTGEDPGDFDEGRTGLLAETADLDTIIGAQDKAADNERANQSLTIQQEQLRLAQEKAERDAAELATGPKPPAGYIRLPDGTVTFEPGGPADPEVIARNTGARRPSGGTPNATIAKEIFEADESIQAGENVVSALDRAIELSSKAYTGPTAGVRGYATSLVGAEGGEATEELANIINTQALESLKATFGSAPTEGERKILIEIQGSVNKAPAVREAIWKRGQAAAKRRIEFNRKKAEDLRAGTYFSADRGSPDDLEARSGPPAGIDPEIWEEMTPEERSAFE